MTAGTCWTGYTYPAGVPVLLFVMCSYFIFLRWHCHFSRLVYINHYGLKRLSLAHLTERYVECIFYEFRKSCSSETFYKLHGVTYIFKVHTSVLTESSNLKQTLVLFIIQFKITDRHDNCQACLFLSCCQCVVSVFSKVTVHLITLTSIFQDKYIPKLMVL